MNNNFILKFGKFKGLNFNQTPLWYQTWLVQQDWFKAPEPPKYNVIRKFVRDYVRGMGVKYEVMQYDLTWEEAQIQAEILNLCEMNDLTECYYIEASK